MSRRSVVACLLLMLGLVGCPLVHAQAPSDTARVRRWREDLAFMARSMREIHPKLFAHIPEARFDSAVAAIDARIPGLDDRQVAVELMRLGSLPLDGHTVLFAALPQIGFHGYYPARLYPFEDGLRVLALPAAHARFVGARVVKIGDVTAEVALERATTLACGDNDRSRRDRAALYLMMPGVLRALGVAPDTSRLRIEVETAGGRTASFEVTPVESPGVPQWFFGGYGVPGGPQRTLFDPASGPTPLHLRTPERAWWFEYLPERRLVYFRFRRVEPFDGGETFARFVARMFAFSDSVGARRFVVDLRQNNGGNNLILQPLIHGLIKRDSLNRRGRLFTIINRETFSAAMNCANWLEDHTRTLFVGEPTGGRPNHFGDTRTLELPHSKAMLLVSEWAWQARLPWDDRVWIAPQLVAPPTVEAWRTGSDPSLEAIFAYLDGGTLGERIQRAAAGEPAAVAAALSAYKQRYPDRWGATSEAELLEVAREMTRREAAIALLEAAVGLYPRSVPAHVRLGEAALDAGRRDEALAWCRKALALSPESRSAKVLMERITAAR